MTERQRLLRLLCLPAVFGLLLLFQPASPQITPAGWRLLALFAATILGLILQPLPGGAIVLIAITLTPLVTNLKLTQALEGYADGTVWLVLAAFFISRALLKTGLARRIALFFVCCFGRTSRGVTYALSASDMVLAAVIPSNAARSGGVILPIARSIASLYGSEPGPTANRIGAYLMTAVYQSICVTASMFFTGQASNPLAAQMAAQHGAQITWTSWLLAGAVPGLLSLFLVPLLVERIQPPTIRETPEAKRFAQTELEKMGPASGHEKILSLVFVVVCLLWATSGWHRLDITVTALLGSCALLLMGVLNWEDIVSERSAWDIFFWYGGLLRLGKALNEAGITRYFADTLGQVLSFDGWPLIFAVTLLIYFYAHYAFASITSHILAMYAPFVGLLLLKGAPLGLTVYGFACFANLSAGLTNYGTTPSPMYFAQGYVTFGRWWKIGALVSLLNLAIWGTLGIFWWRILGLW